MAGQRGAAAQLSGSSFESLILTSAPPRLVLEKIPNGARRIGGGESVHTKSPFDFAGTVAATGRAIMFDAKSLSDDEASFRPHASKSTIHQVARLKRQDDAGAIAGFLVRCQRHGDIRWIAARVVTYSPIGWDDPRWFILCRDSGLIDFRTLIDRYAR